MIHTYFVKNVKIEKQIKFKTKWMYKFKPLASNNKNTDIAVFLNIFKIFRNESLIVHFSFYNKPYIGLVVKKNI